MTVVDFTIDVQTCARCKTPQLFATCTTVYIYTVSKPDKPVHYIGRTSNLIKRASEHRLTYGDDIIIDVINSVHVSNLEDSILVEQIYINHYLNMGYELDNVISYIPSIWVKGLDNDIAFKHALRVTIALLQTDPIPDDTLKFYRKYTSRLTLYIGGHGDISTRIVADKWIGKHKPMYPFNEIKPEYNVTA